MNSLLRSVIRPGIYNANMGICNNSDPTVGDVSGNTGGLCLLIKRGTTFVFSNDYWKESGSIGYRRNFNHADPASLGITSDENFCLIKSVALSDMKVYLGTVSGAGNYSVYAYMKYDPLNTDTSDTPSPTFFLAKEGSDGHLYSHIGLKRYSSEYGGGDVDVGQTQTLILDGASEIDPKSDSLAFYLNVGFIKASGSNSVTVFTGRGLPEYRYSSTLDSYKMVPDIIPDFNNEGTLLFDIPESFVGTTIVKNPDKLCTVTSEFSDWEGAYLNSRRRSISENTDPITSKVSFSSTDTGVFAVYGLVSNIKSYSSAAEGVGDTVLKFGKCLLPTSVTLSKSSIGDVTFDVSYMNIYSLLNGIQGKDIWSYVIDGIRGDGNPNEITDIIPMALVTVEEGKINHAQTLSYFGLQERLGKINTLNVREHNIFNVIPVME